MSGEKNDLFTSLSSFLKLCQLSLLCSHTASLQLCWGDALWPPRTQTEGKLRENPFSWSSFDSCRPCSRSSCKSPVTATCGFCLHWLLEPGLDRHLIHGWEMLFLPTSHVPVLPHPDDTPLALLFRYTLGTSSFWKVPELGQAGCWL